jgi:hypothetical protein
MRVWWRFAVNHHRRPCQLPSDQAHSGGQDRPDAQEHEPEQRQEWDGGGSGDTIEEDRQGCALPTKGPCEKRSCQRLSSNRIGQQASDIGYRAGKISPHGRERPKRPNFQKISSRIACCGCRWNLTQTRAAADASGCFSEFLWRHPGFPEGRLVGHLEHAQSGALAPVGLFCEFQFCVPDGGCDGVIAA